MEEVARITLRLMKTGQVGAQAMGACKCSDWGALYESMDEALEKAPELLRLAQSGHSFHCGEHPENKRLGIKGW